MVSSRVIIKRLDELFPDAHCELEHRNEFELLIAVILSAQTTDKRVNLVTPRLFSLYPDAFSLAKADSKDVEEIIHSIGLYHHKSLNIIACAKALVTIYDGVVPGTREELEKLPGVGRKTANVVLANCFNVAAFAVDTHVHRVAYRSGIRAKDDDVLETEKKLMAFFPKKHWSKLHHQFIFFGRYLCHSKNPACDRCPFNGRCNYLR